MIHSERGSDAVINLPAYPCQKKENGRYRKWSIVIAFLTL